MAATTVGHFRNVLAHFGLPVCLVMDNGTSFTGVEFQDFVRENGIWSIHMAPHNSNGLAEIAVRSMKEGLK